jgi:hypothetical protein
MKSVVATDTEVHLYGCPDAPVDLVPLSVEDALIESLRVDRPDVTIHSCVEDDA